MASSAKYVTSRSYKENCPTPPSGHFHDDWAKNVTSRVKMRHPPPLPGSHVFQRTGTIFKLNSRIQKTNKTALPTGGHFHDEKMKTALSPWHPCFSTETNLLTKFHEDWKFDF
ncbi:hypothetical protein DPMN_069897 [Dreissena polymorpha]|uniref:Uncharacterized protein n=1 Tax=Dreissena polymorpha TaxID=45954 RepID=A0A9D4BVA3_DREPO|nr:hypothetical protein DPMN_069897 [Dreissena polymorpha]